MTVIFSLAFFAVLCHAETSEPLRDSNGRIARSESAKNAFKRQHPCPANGRTSGPCPGYVIDHKLPLVCGGADAPSNMQWQTVPDGKAKDRWELTLPGCPAKFSTWHRLKRSLKPGEK